MTELCFEALAQSLFGEDMSEARPLVAAAAEALHQFHHLHAQWIGAVGGLAFAAVRAVSTALGRPDFVADPTLLPTSYGRRFRDATAALDRYVTRLVARRRAAPGGDDFLSMLLAARDDAGAPLSERQIRDEVVTMFLAGHETAASSLTWALYLLAAHPPAAQRLAAALDRDAGGAGEREIDRVMREALRLYPPAYRISRTAVQACDLGGHRRQARRRDHDSAVGGSPLGALLRRARCLSSRALDTGVHGARCPGSPTSRSAAGRARASATPSPRSRAASRSVTSAGASSSAFPRTRGSRPIWASRCCRVTTCSSWSSAAERQRLLHEERRRHFTVWPRVHLLPKARSFQLGSKVSIAGA